MPENLTCPSGLKRSIRAMLMRGERILADLELAKAGGQIDELLSACWEETLEAGPYDFGDKVVDWGKVLLGDRFDTLPQDGGRRFPGVKPPLGVEHGFVGQAALGGASFSGGEGDTLAASGASVGGG